MAFRIKEYFWPNNWDLMEIPLRSSPWRRRIKLQSYLLITSYNPRHLRFRSGCIESVPLKNHPEYAQVQRQHFLWSPLHIKTVNNCVTMTDLGCPQLESYRFHSTYIHIVMITQSTKRVNWTCLTTIAFIHVSTWFCVLPLWTLRTVKGNNFLVTTTFNINWTTNEGIVI